MPVCSGLPRNMEASWQKAGRQSKHRVSTRRIFIVAKLDGEVGETSRRGTYEVKVRMSAVSAGTDINPRVPLSLASLRRANFREIGGERLDSNHLREYSLVDVCARTHGTARPNRYRQRRRALRSRA